MIAAVPFVILVLVVVALVLLTVLYRKVSRYSTVGLESRLESFERAQERTERVVKEEIALSRSESSKSAGDQRQELSGAFKTFGDSVGQRIGDVAGLQKGQLDAFATQLSQFVNASSEKLDGARGESASAASQLRQDVVTTLTNISDTMTRTLKDLATAEKLQLEAFSGHIESLTKTSGEKLDGIKSE